MKHWELEHSGELIRIETDQEALEHTFEVLLQLSLGVVETATEPTETRTEYCARMGFDM
jgi:hypothetical protein